MRTILLSLTLSFSIGAPAAQCHYFANFDGAVGEPTQIDCGATAKSFESCKKACAKVAMKSCPKGAKSFSGSVNFNDPTKGFEVNQLEGNCKK